MKRKRRPAPLVGGSSNKVTVILPGGPATKRRLNLLDAKELADCIVLSAQRVSQLDDEPPELDIRVAFGADDETIMLHFAEPRSVLDIPSHQAFQLSREIYRLIDG